MFDFEANLLLKAGDWQVNDVELKNENGLLVLFWLLLLGCLQVPGTPVPTTSRGSVDNIHFPLTTCQSLALRKGSALKIHARFVLPIKISILFNLLCIWIWFHNASICSQLCFRSFLLMCFKEQVSMTVMCNDPKYCVHCWCSDFLGNF